ncbi:MAG: glycosyltransferase [Alsobacter sp.]
MTIVAVIIPFFQRRPGILRRALTSVVGQRLPHGVHVHIYICDDASPVRSDGEVRDLPLPDGFSIEVIVQQNGGASAARNACLDAMKPNTDFVAFLDSDDYWEPGHLAAALALLGRGFDYYFCNNRRVGAHDSYFAQNGFGQYLKDQGTPLGEDDYEVPSAAFMSFSLRAWTSLTPTVVFRRSAAPELRFNPALRAAGEDCHFLLHLISRTDRVCCSTAINVTCADGVNIFYSTYDWDDPGHLPRRVGQLQKSYLFLSDLPISDADRRYVLSCIAREREDVVFFSLREMGKKGPGAFGKLDALRRTDRHFWSWYLPTAAKIAVRLPFGGVQPRD